ncbi:MAG: hypothetical protein D6705_16520 [Deltaproteobacteria bacterium]|nr:MAG: hypothetical protein D6705_16520 [Deltaproteobacteria bacterium]
MTLSAVRRHLPWIAAAAAWVVPAAGWARPNVDRTGGHAAATVGAAGCLPGKAPCARDDAADLAPGRTKLGFGFGAELGFRWKYVLLGAAYDFGMLRPDYDVVNGPDYTYAYQHGVYALVRPILPLWRIDLGLDLAPGFSRQTFRNEAKQKEFSQGFSMRVGPVATIFLTRRFFLGARVSFLVNAHTRTCRDDGNLRTCSRDGGDYLAGVHQVLFGIVIGGTFL